MTTMEYFRKKTYCDPITADGQMERAASGPAFPAYDINYSTILTILIQEAGRWCKAYASDLFIEWEDILEQLRGQKPLQDGSHLFGFREFGVDYAQAILNNYNSGEASMARLIASNKYRAIWRLDIQQLDIPEGGDFGKRVKMTLYEVDR